MSSQNASEDHDHPADTAAPDKNLRSTNSDGNEIDRRSFLHMMGTGTLAVMSPLPVPVWPGINAEFDPNIPADKQLSSDWIKALFERGTPEIFHGEELRTIGMPVSGICAGHVYLSGDGRLTGWRVDGHPTPSRGGPSTLLPLKQCFALRTVVGGKTDIHFLNQDDFPGVTFRGEYPIAKVEYQKTASPAQVSLEAFSPFIPLDADDSGLPATILRFTVKNVSDTTIEATLLGSLQNGACFYNRHGVAGIRRNHIYREQGLTVLSCTAEPAKVEMSTGPSRPDILFEDWTKPNFEGWTVEGTGFGSGPIERSATEDNKGDVGGLGLCVVSSFFPSQKNESTGKLTSATFTISRSFINIWMGGGDLEDKTCVRLRVEGQPTQSQVGLQDVRLSLHYFDVRGMGGKQATLEIVDASGAESGDMSVGRISFSDIAGDGTPLEKMPDYGSMALALLGTPAEIGIANGAIGFDGQSSDDARVPLAESLLGSLGRSVNLKPGESSEVTFVVTWHFPSVIATWHFPHMSVKLGNMGRYYATKFNSAHSVANYVTANFDRLTEATRLWRDTWYDSTLPYWFLDRILINASTLATSGCYRFADGRFYAFEGGPSNWPGTCTHVWQYAHSVSRLFPELERDTRERVDLNIAMHPDTGVIGFRAEFDMGLAVDGQAGTLLRFYREHQISPDNTFLMRNWGKIKKAYDPLFALDAHEFGILEGEQMNTRDRPWFGQISWLSSLYVAALRAGEQMAIEVDDNEFAKRCRRVSSNGSRNIVARLFNGDYFISRVDPKHLDTVNSGMGCDIDQVFGQSWAFQIGLPRILPEKETRSALRSIWRYNYSPRAGTYAAAHKGNSRLISVGQAGLIQCTFPHADWDYFKASGGHPDNGLASYFNQTWTGQEYQVASHMIWEGMLLEGMAIVRSIHDRYNPINRNPWAEIEAGNHYTRAMASHGVFLAICGFEYHSPAQFIGFAPKLTPENFRAPFTAAEGWGSYAQDIQPGRMNASLQIRFGHLKLKTIGLEWMKASEKMSVKASLGNEPLHATFSVVESRIKIQFPSTIIIRSGTELSLEVECPD